MFYRYEKFRLVDIPKLQSRIPLTLTATIELLKESCRDATHKLKEKWIAECCEIVNNNREAIEHWMPTQQVCALNYCTH